MSRLVRKAPGLSIEALSDLDARMRRVCSSLLALRALAGSEALQIAGIEVSELQLAIEWAADYLYEEANQVRNIVNEAL